MFEVTHVQSGEERAYDSRVGDRVVVDLDSNVSSSVPVIIGVWSTARTLRQQFQYHQSIVYQSDVYICRIFSFRG